MLKCVIFDMDGVIIDSEPMHYKVNRLVFERLGLNISDEEYNRFIGSTNREMWTCFKGKYNLIQTVEELVDNQVNENVDHLRSMDVRPIPGIECLLEDLRNNRIICGVASSSEVKYIEMVMSKFGIKEYFKAIVSGQYVERSKPAPDIFLHASKVLDVTPEECVVIEDSQNGVRAAKAAGMKCVGFKNMNSGDQDLTGADLIVDTIESISVAKLMSMWA